MPAGRTFNCGEFATIKLRIEDRLPDAAELNGVAVSQPIGDEIPFLAREDSDLVTSDREGGFLHVV